jgi:hypothetical protein
MPEQSDLRLLFLDTALFEDGAMIRGGSLITDGETKPYEFRCTSPIKPTQLQRMLYGDTLEEYIHIELIGVPLVNASKEKPSLVLVRNPILLRIRPLVAYPVILLRRDQKSTIETDEANGTVKPIAISSHRDFLAETSSAQMMLAALIQRRDLLEPFDRLQIAVSEAHKQRIGAV